MKISKRWELQQWSHYLDGKVECWRQPQLHLSKEIAEAWIKRYFDTNEKHRKNITMTYSLKEVDYYEED